MNFLLPKPVFALAVLATLASQAVLAKQRNPKGVRIPEAPVQLRDNQVFSAADLIGRTTTASSRRSILPWCAQTDRVDVENASPAPVDAKRLQLLADEVLRRAAVDCAERPMTVLELAGAGWNRRLSEADGWTLRTYTGQSSAQADVAASAKMRQQLERRAVRRDQRTRAEDAQAAYALGLLLHLGPGQHDYVAAKAWYEQAAAAKIPEAYYLLGLLYESGEGVGFQDTKRNESYQLAANAGHVGAMVRLAQLQVNRMRHDQNVAWNMEMLLYIQQGIDAGIPDAMELMARRYRHTTDANGRYIMSEAVKHYEAASRGNHCPSRIQLGDMYYYGEGLPHDVGKAIEWYQSATQCVGIRQGEYAFAEKKIATARANPKPFLRTRDSDVTPQPVLPPLPGERGYLQLALEQVMAAVANQIANEVLDPRNRGPAAAPPDFYSKNPMSVTSNPYDWNVYLTRQVQCRAIAQKLCF